MFVGRLKGIKRIIGVGEFVNDRKVDICDYRIGTAGGKGNSCTRWDSNRLLGNLLVWRKTQQFVSL